MGAKWSNRFRKKAKHLRLRSDARESRGRGAMVLVLVLAGNGFCIAVYISINRRVRLSRNGW